jgi:site-specific recombinase XerD
MGLSAEAQQAYLEGYAHSTVVAYERKWKLFLVWWESLSLKPEVLSPEIVAEFLLFLRQKGKTPERIREYLSMLASTFQPTLQDSWGANNVLKFLVRSFSAKVTTAPVSTPKWNINIVLRYLQSDTFKYWNKLPFPLLARKTAFLLLFASAARLSEASAWTKEVTIVPKVSATLNAIHSFLPKNTSRYRLHRPLRPLVIPALSPITQDHVELRLCPVKSLTFYLENAVPHRGDRETLFFPYSKKSRLTRQALARWMKILIVHAYRWADPEKPLPERPTAHEIRAIAASYAALREVSLDHILQQCHWGQQSIFTSTYLRDMHDLSFISSTPVVASSAVLPAS